MPGASEPAVRPVSGEDSDRGPSMCPAYLRPGECHAVGRRGGLVSYGKPFDLTDLQGTGRGTYGPAVYPLVLPNSVRVERKGSA